MRVSVVGSQTNGGARLGFGPGQFPTFDQCAGKIHMRLSEIWFQTQCDSKLRNAFRDMLLRQEDPTEKIMPLGAAGCELYDLFESVPSVREIATLQGRQTLPIRRLGRSNTITKGFMARLWLRLDG